MRYTTPAVVVDAEDIRVKDEVDSGAAVAVAHEVTIVEDEDAAVASSGARGVVSAALLAAAARLPLLRPLDNRVYGLNTEGPDSRSLFTQVGHMPLSFSI